jgi:hypothetical protein
MLGACFAHTQPARVRLTDPAAGNGPGRSQWRRATGHARGASDPRQVPLRDERPLPKKALQDPGTRPALDDLEAGVRWGKQAPIDQYRPSLPAIPS